MAMVGQGRGSGDEDDQKYCFDSHEDGNIPIQTHLLVDQLQTFQQNPSEIYTTTSVHHDHNNIVVDKSNSLIWKGLFFSAGEVHGPPGATTTTTTTTGPSSSKHDFYDHETLQHMVVVNHEQQQQQDDEDEDDDRDHETSNSGGAILLPNWQHHHHHHHVVFPCEGNERPSQGLSLSLSSTNPSAIGLQSFELRPQQQQDLIRFVPSDHDHESFFPKPINNNNSNNSNGSSSTVLIHDDQHPHHGQQFDQIRSSKYLIPAQHLLNEFCNLGTNHHHQQQQPKTLRTTTNFKPHKDIMIDHDKNNNNNKLLLNSSTLYSLDLLHLHKRKSKLLSILEQLDRRYRHYCDQMKAVVSSFESVAGNGAADVYSTMASKAMSKHFRCLRDGIVGQIKATKKAMGEKDMAAPGTTRGDTPRLRVLDQTLRQQKAFQQMTLMETHPWRPQRGLPERSVSVLRAWLFEHFLHPYPSDVDKHILARQTGLSRSQVSNWFINARVRLWKPMVEEMYTEELREAQLEAKPEEAGDDDDDVYNNNNRKPGGPAHVIGCGQLTRIDSECLSSVINNGRPELGIKNNVQMGFGSSFGGVELDFSTYAAAGGGSGGGSGVSLTLELQQHGGGGGGGGGNGVSLAFSPAGGQSSLFYSREQMEDCQPAVQYLLEGDQGQSLPYRFLMGAQLLNDLAG